MPRRRKKREPEAELRPRRPIALPCAAVVFVLLLLVYLATVIPTAVDQDSGELAAAAHVLGIAHPTGYPLWVLLGRAFDYLPVGGTSAYRVALLSAVSAAAAGALVAAMAAALTSATAPALGAGLAFGLWNPTWSQAVLAEVYGLSALLSALALIALQRWERGRSRRALYWLALAVGFVSMHHRTAMLAVLPALVAAAALTRPRRARVYAAAAALFIAPFALYLYLPIRAAARPPLNWTNPSTWDRFWDHVLATQYQHFAFSHSLEEMLEVSVSLLPEVLAPGAALSVLIALVGLPLIGWGWRRWADQQPASAWSLLVGAALLCIWVLQWGETSDLKVFLLPLGLVLALCGAVGLARLRERLGGPHGGLAAAGLAAVLCGALLAANWDRCNLRDMWQHRDRWVAVLSQMERDAIFVSDFDVPSFATLYLQNVEGLRRDVHLIRAVRVPDWWYQELIEDEELRAAVRESWRAAGARVLEVRERTALFAAGLGQRLRGRRPVYALHGPIRVPYEGPPHFVSLSEDLVEIAFETPEVLRPWEEGPPAAELPGGVTLVDFELERTEAGTGELVGFTARWRLSAAPPGQFGLLLEPVEMDPARFRRRLLPRGRFLQGFPLVYGLRDLGPTPEGAVYEQQGVLIVPTNAPPGPHAVRVAVGPPWAEFEGYRGWTEVARLMVQPRPRPTNPP